MPLYHLLVNVAIKSDHPPGSAHLFDEVSAIFTDYLEGSGTIEAWGYAESEGRFGYPVELHERWHRDVYDHGEFPKHKGLKPE